MISSAERQYYQLIEMIQSNGTESKPTKGTCLSVFGHTITLIPEEVPLLLGRKIYWEGLVGELRAFIANENTVAGFESHGCNFWGSWSNEDGSLDVDYARLLHNFNEVNQLSRVIGNICLRPHSRKHVISLWDPSSDAKQVPCVLSYQWYVSAGRLHMIWTQRSADVMVGLASDMFSAWLLNKLMAGTCSLKPGTVTMNLGDCHIYEEHYEAVDIYKDAVWASESIANQPICRTYGSIKDFSIQLQYYNPMPPIKFELKV